MAPAVTQRQDYILTKNTISGHNNHSSNSVDLISLFSLVWVNFPLHSPMGHRPTLPYKIKQNNEMPLTFLFLNVETWKTYRCTRLIETVRMTVHVFQLVEVFRKLLFTCVSNVTLVR